MPSGGKRASMGPRLDSRGNRGSLEQRGSHEFASMGPRLDSRGNNRCGGFRLIGGAPLQWGRDLIVAETAVASVRRRGEWRLQWGRDLIVAETAVQSNRYGSFDMLQWGRDLIVAETRFPSKRARRDCLLCFNGAAT